jgi:hypothetical protein
MENLFRLLVIPPSWLGISIIIPCFIASLLFTKTYNTGTTWKSSQVPVLGSIISHVLSRVSAWLYLFDGPRLIQEGYDKVSMHAF